MTSLNQLIKTVSIVGAGPGDPELLTLKALNRIQNADVILYDNLVTKSILDLSSNKADKIYAGKKCGDSVDPVKRQLSINEQLRSYAIQGKKVLRLKSGDPFIYGRAAEEIRYLLEHDIPFEVIPGISAGIAAANLIHIPLTERNYNNTIVFCTGHTANYDFEQLDALAAMLKTGTSLVMYMGLKTLNMVIEKIKPQLSDTEIFVSAISNVSNLNQSSITGTLNDIEQKIMKQSLPMPVVFIIGKHAYPITKETVHPTYA